MKLQANPTVMGRIIPFEAKREYQTLKRKAGLDNACATCPVERQCWSSGFSAEELALVEEALVYTRRKLARGSALYRAGDHFDYFYAVRTGFFKSVMIHLGGQEQVTGFQMPGELLGFDGLCEGRYTSDAIAIEDSEVCAIPYRAMDELSHQMPSLGRHFHQLMSRQIVREQGIMTLLGVMTAEERVAAFLLNLSSRYKNLGYSPAVFSLRMTREDIGNFLGLKVETVSRAFSKFVHNGLIYAANKDIELIDRPGLKKILHGFSLP